MRGNRRLRGGGGRGSHNDPSYRLEDSLRRLSHGNRNSFTHDIRVKKRSVKAVANTRSRSVVWSLDHPFNHSDHANELVHEVSPEPDLRHYTLHQRSQLPSWEKGFKFQEKAIISDYASDDPSWKFCRQTKSRELHERIDDPLQEISIGFQGNGMVMEKSTFFEEGSSSGFHSNPALRSTIGSAEGLDKSGIFGTGIHESRMHHHHVLHLDPYDDADSEKVYSSDLSMPSFHLRSFNRASSSNIIKEGHHHHHHHGFHRNLCDDVERKKVYSRDSFLPKMHPFQPRPLGSTSSTSTEKEDQHHHVVYRDSYESMDKKRVYSRSSSVVHPSQPRSINFTSSSARAEEEHHCHRPHRDSSETVDMKSVYSSSLPKTHPYRPQPLGCTSSSIVKEEHHHHDLHSYDDIGWENVYSRDSSLSKKHSFQPMHFVSASSSNIVKEDATAKPIEHMLDELPPDISRYPNVSSKTNAHMELLLSGLPAKNGTCDMSQAYSHEPHSQRRQDSFRYLAPENLSRRATCVYQSEFEDAVDTTFLDNSVVRIGTADASRRHLVDGILLNQHHSLHGDTDPDEHHQIVTTCLDNSIVRIGTADASRRHLIDGILLDRHQSLHGDTDPDQHHQIMRTACEVFPSESYSECARFKFKSSNDHKNVPSDKMYSCHESDGPPVDYEEHRTGNAFLSDTRIDIHHQGNDLFHGRALNKSLIDQNIERVETPHYSINGNIDETDLHNMHLNVQSALVGKSSCWNEEMPSNEKPVRLPSSERMLFEHNHSKNFSHRQLRSDTLMHSPGITLKKKCLKGGLVVHDLFPSEEKQGLIRPCKHRKRSPVERPVSQNELFDYKSNSSTKKHRKRSPDERPGSQYELFDDKSNSFAKTDPPEGSEEFKNLVYKSFLQYSKLLNETLHRQSILEGQQESKKLQCLVCGSKSKKFASTFCLANHAFHSLKIGLRTAHLGFYKSLCVLMGWNWNASPDKWRAYQTEPFPEAKALREDLILWPPVVIIHNISMGNKSSTVEDIEKLLQDMGVDARKARVGLGNPPNQSLFLAKFTATLSGLREAEKLHRLFADRECGKPEFELVPASHDCCAAENGEIRHDCVYAYMALAEDLDKLDRVTKKRSMLKSKRDIEAIADAPIVAV